MADDHRKTSPLDERPNLSELHEHVNVGVKWRQMGIQLQLDDKLLSAIDQENALVNDKLCSMFTQWLSQNPDGTRRNVLKALKVIKENNTAKKYEKIWEEEGRDAPALTKNVADSLEKLRQMMKEPTKSDDEFAKKLFALKDAFLQHFSREVIKSIRIDDAKDRFFADLQSTFANGCNSEFMKTYRSCVDKMNNGEELVQFLIDHNFSSYFNYQPLKKLAGDGCVAALAVYEEMYNDLLNQLPLPRIASIFLKNPGLVPGRVIGFPTLQFQLIKPELYTSLLNWMKSLPQTLPSHIANVHEINGRIVFIYSIYPPCSLPNLFSILKDPSYAENFQRRGVSISLDSFHACTLIPHVTDDGDDNNSYNEAEAKGAAEVQATKQVDVPEAVGALLWPLGITEVFSLSGELDQTLTGQPMGPDKLKTMLIDPTIKIKVQPLLLSFTGLPQSGKTKAVNDFMDNYVDKIPPYLTPIIKKNAQSETKGGITQHNLLTVCGDKGQYEAIEASEESIATFGILSAFKHIIETKGKVPILGHDAAANVDQCFSQADLNTHFQRVYRFLNKHKSIPKGSELTDEGRLYAGLLQQSLPEGLGLVNIWDLASTNTVHHLLSALQGHLYNSHMWLFLDLDRDLKILDEPFDMELPAKDGALLLKLRPRLHYLLRSCWSTIDNARERKGVCTMFATHQMTGPGKARDNIRLLKDKVQVVARQIGVSALLDDRIDSINLKTNNKRLNETFQRIIVDETPFVEVPISWLFLRSLFYRYDKMFIGKGKLAELANECNIKAESLTEFCKFFTSFGSIVDLSLINPNKDNSEYVIVKPIDFLKLLDAFFNRQDEIYQKYPSMSYGLVPESAGREKFGNDWLGVLETLVCLNLAIRVMPGYIDETHLAIDRDKIHYYIPLCCTGTLISDPDPDSVHLITNINTPHFFRNVSFVDKLVKSLPEPRLIPCQSMNQTIIKDLSTNTTITISFHVPAIKFHLDQPNDELCSRIVQATHQIAEGSPVTVKYKFVRFCAKSHIPNVESLPSANYHVLPEALCSQCQDEGKVDELFQAWKKAVKEHPTPKVSRPTGELGPHELIRIAKKLLKFSPNDLHVIVTAFDGQVDDNSESLQENALATILMKWHDQPSRPDKLEVRRALALKIAEIGEIMAKKVSDERAREELQSKYIKLAKETDLFFVQNN